jgi:site-specific recombinase XerD
MKARGIAPSWKSFFSSGMRIAELVALDVRDVASLIRKKAPPNTLELAIVGKGKRVRTVFLSPCACSCIRAYLEERGPDDDELDGPRREPSAFSVFRAAVDEERLVIGKYGRAAGLGKKVTPHTFRHSYATDLLSNAADLRSVQELLGHKNVATTQRYTHVTNKRLRDIHEQFHGPDRFRNR